MKRILVVMLLTLAGFVLSGCASFGDMTDADDWYGLMGRDAFVKHQQDQLAIDKLSILPINGHAVGNGIANNVSSTGMGCTDGDGNFFPGYEGQVFNKGTSDRNVVCTGPERMGFYVEAREAVMGCLIPGSYSCASYNSAGECLGAWTMNVGRQLHVAPGGKHLHWYLVVGGR